jgi:hypothetical protein
MNWSREVRASLSSWRKYQGRLRTLRKMARRNPTVAAFAFELAGEELQSKAFIDLYYYGVASPQARYQRRVEELEDLETEVEKEALFYETYYHDRERYEELAAQGFFDLSKVKEELLRRGPSLNIDEEVRSTLAAMQHTTYKMVKYRMRVAGEESRAAGQGYYGPGVCEAFLETSEQFPVIFAGVVQEKWGGDPRTRQRAAASLTGWVGSRISLSRNLRLKAALEGERGISAFEQLLEALGGAVAVEWAALERPMPLDVLVTRSALRLEKEGDQAGRLRHVGKLAAQRPDEEHGSDEPDLKEFMLREELRALKEVAELTEQEHQVLQLALEALPNRVIAERLNISENTVKTHKRVGRKKLKQAAGQ